MTVLDGRALNRATLARQLLLEPADLAPHDAVAHLCGLQAQEPQEPFIGLWTRLSGFDPAELSELLTRRRVVRTHLMRRTIHLLTAEDLLSWRSRHEAMLLQRVLGVYRSELAEIDLDELAAAGRDVLAGGEPHSQSELARAVAHRWPDHSARALGEVVVGALIPVVQLPPRGLWRTGGAARYLPVSTWLGREVDRGSPDDEVGRHLVLRYLAAFGPAATADIRAWSGLAGLPGAVKSVRDQLVSFRDQRGRELLDLPDAPRPDPDVPVRALFLPAFDNALLGYDDRSRIIDDAHRGVSVAGERAVLVDGRVAGTWTFGDAGVNIAPLRSFSRAQRRDLLERGSELALFLSGGESDQARVI